MHSELQPVEHGPKSTEVKRVVIIGLDPWLIDFSSPDFAAFSGLTVEKLLAGITSAEESLKALGCEAQHCAGVRADPSHFILFEKLIDVVHEHAPSSKICFNTNPSDTFDALQRWL